MSNSRSALRLATYNVEWFDALFDDAGRLLIGDDGWSGRRDVTKAQQIDALGKIFKAVDADATLVVEAPDEGRKRQTIRALEAFAAHFGLRSSRAVSGFKSDTQQELTLLYDPDIVEATHDPKGPDMGAPRFDGLYQLDLDVDATPDPITFSKPPLELAVSTKDGRRFRMIGVHAKSKAPHGARTEAEVMAISIANRRKQMAQCIWLRHRIEAHLAAGDSLIVLGDFNDGPGLDEYEKLFGRSSIEIVLGAGSDMPLFDPHARMALSRPTAGRLATARFYLSREKRFLSALLDYIMVSDDIRQEAPEWRIWHPFDDPECYECTDLRDALLTASDHFPVSIDLPTPV